MHVISYSLGNHDEHIVLDRAKSLYLNSSWLDSIYFSLWSKSQTTEEMENRAASVKIYIYTFFFYGLGDLNRNLNLCGGVRVSATFL